MSKSKLSSYPWHLPVAYMQNLADNKSSPPVRILQKRHLTSKKFNARWKNSAREKKNVPEKILKFLPEKKKSQPEKKYEKVHEKTSNCPRKKLKKVGEKKNSAREKNQKKCPKPFSRALFIFSGKKKTLFKSTVLHDIIRSCMSISKVNCHRETGGVVFKSSSGLITGTVR